jgi:hypothetical protein
VESRVRSSRVVSPAVGLHVSHPTCLSYATRSVPTRTATLGAEAVFRDGVENGSEAASQVGWLRWRPSNGRFCVTAVAYE